MHGQIHDCLRLMILTNYNRDVWKKILLEASSDEEKDFLKLRHYDDALTMRLWRSTAAVLGVTYDEALLEYGHYFIQYDIDLGYAEMLRSLGQHFPDFVENLDTVHTLLAVSYKNIIPPQFRCERFHDDTLILHHYSVRPGLQWLVAGLMLGAADLLHGVKLEYNVEHIGPYQTDNSAPQYHSALHLRVRPNGATQHLKVDHFMGHFDPPRQSPKSDIKITTKAEMMPLQTILKLSSSSSLQQNNSENGNKESLCILDGCREVETSLEVPQMTSQSFSSLFPYHIVFDKNLVIKRLGNMLGQFFPHIQCGSCFKETFHIIYPRMPVTFKAIGEYAKTCFVVGVVNKTFSLKGEMRSLGEDHIIFVCSPVLATLTELEQKKIFICDLPIHDTTREFLLLNQLRQAEIGISLKLEETTAALQRTAAELETEKAKTDTLLHEMLPVKVVRQLREGRRVEAEKFDVCTILFTDIVTFTNIAAAVTPMEVVDLLNHLYSIFDRLTISHGVYKVETIGDAYMVVGGVPDPDPAHAQQVGRLALDMQTESAQVISPLTRQSIQIRIGLHTGSVVAGVVGDKMPRYCLFGDTVNTASRMESHGLPGHIHVSPVSHSFLADAGFHLATRGKIRVKGKGSMTTYFLLAAPSSGEDTKLQSSSDVPQQNGVQHTQKDHCSTVICQIL